MDDTRYPWTGIETKAGKARGTLVPHSFLNEVVQSEGDRLNGVGFVFDPKESDAEIQARLETPPKKKK